MCWGILTGSSQITGFTQVVFGSGNPVYPLSDLGIDGGGDDVTEGMIDGRSTGPSSMGDLSMSHRV